MTKLSTAIAAAEAFVAKEIKGADTVVESIAAWIKKEEPAVQQLLTDAIAAYKVLLAAAEQDKTAIQAIEALILSLIAA